jgi:outer membrane biosynthesis protein TonB
MAFFFQQLMSVYSKIVQHPIDLGKVCRRVRRHQYTNLRQVRIDTWRIFANCVKYHSHPNNKHAVPSFVSIALHLRDFFNDLWQEHVLPSDNPPPPPPSSSSSGKGNSATKGSNKLSNDPYADLRATMEERDKDRKRRLVVSGLSGINGNSLNSTIDALEKLVENGGRVDQLDVLPIWGDAVTRNNTNDDDDVREEEDRIINNLKTFAQNLRETASRDEDIGVDEFDVKIRNCYTTNTEKEFSTTWTTDPLKRKIACRLGRFVGQLIVPINEASCRGVSQSSIWGCMAAGVWARESSKKPFWPALVLGIIAPTDQSEEWHKALTERNEARLPEKLKGQLMSGKRKAEQAIKRQAVGLAEPQSFFLVEFLGSHEFIWVREADIVENFSPDNDPNKKDTDPGTSRKKRISRSHLNNILGSKTYASAIEEAQWALEEFEQQLQDNGLESSKVSEEEGHTEEGYSFNVLSQSDDETEEGDEDPSLDSLDMDECNELLATNGLLDYSTAGRKKRAQILKQHKLDAEKKKKALKVRKERADKAKKVKDAKEKEKEQKQEQRDLEKKRRKRTREREKALKGIEHQKKKLKLSDPAPGRRHLIISKKERAEAIVNGYINRTAKMGQYKSLSLGGGEEKWIPSAVIDSTNLCGMALAFRAAAGMIPMPNPVTTGPGKKIFRPWDVIRLQRKKTSDERCMLLEKQIELVEKEIKIVHAQKERRIALLKQAREAVAEMENSIILNDEAARENPLKKARKSHPLSGKKRSKVTEDDDGSVESMDLVEETVKMIGKENQFGDD